METHDLFALALGMKEPWYVASIEFSPDQRELVIGLDFRRGGTFPCPECGSAECKAYDSEERRWRHLNFFQYKTTLRARVPRVDCGKCGKRMVEVPWSRSGSGFTLLFEALILAMAPHMPMAAVARLVREHDTRLWRVVRHYVDKARAERDDSKVCRVGIDETASRRGHNYISLFVDLDGPAVLFGTEGKDAATVAAFAADLKAHGGNPEKVTEVCQDMSAAFIKGVTESLPNASITFDKFHVKKIITDAVDQTRRAERDDFPELKGMRYALLRNEETMSDEQLEFVSSILMRKSTMKTARAVHLRLTFDELYALRSPRAARRHLTRWCNWAVRSRIPAMIDAGKTIRRHFEGVLRWFTSHITNGILEGINSLVQAAKAKARGYRSTRNLITMTYLIAGRLQLNQTHLR